MGKKIVVELTNRCNLHCQHCFAGRHGGRNDLPLTVLQQVLHEAHRFGFDELSFTGGDPTIYRYFAEAVHRTATAGYRFAVNTNGWNFTQIYPILLSYQEALTIITFSMDGASETTHDQLRGTGSFRRLMQAMSICVIKQIPFSINMVITGHNRHELAKMTTLASKLGARGVRFGHLMPAPLTTVMNFDLSPGERIAAEAEIRELAQSAQIPIVMAPGHQSAELFPCSPLQLLELNINCYGELTKCCHLSGHGADVGNDDVMGSLTDHPFGELYTRLVAENMHFCQSKRDYFACGHHSLTDTFPCWYCSRAYDKIGWMQAYPDHPWQP